MDKNLYFKLMEETSNITDKIILDIITSNYSGNLKDLVSELPIKRANSGRPKSRPSLFRFSYETAGGKNWRNYEKVASALEMLNLSTYTLNYVLDDKGGEKSKQQRNNECMASIIQRELAQDLLREDLSPEQFFRIDKRFSKINRFTSGNGQYLDGNNLREIEENYLEQYIERCENLTGKFMENVCEIGGVLAEANEDEIKKLGEYGKNYGTVVQIINDLGDYLPARVGSQSVGKVYQDQYSDLRHGCITFPAYHILRFGNKDEKEAIVRVQGNLTSSNDDCDKITKALIRLDSTNEVKRLAKKFALKSKKALHKLPKSLGRDFLSTATSMYRTNKFYEAFKSI